MPYQPNTSFNYTPMSLEQIRGDISGNELDQAQNFAGWMAERGFNFADLLRQDRNTQQQVANQFQRDQFNATQRQQAWQNQMAEQMRNQQIMDAAMKRGTDLWSTPEAQARLKEDRLRLARPFNQSGLYK